MCSLFRGNNCSQFRTKALIKQLSGISVVAISPLHTECPLMMRKPLTHSWLSILLLINALQNSLQYFSWISSLFEFKKMQKRDDPFVCIEVTENPYHFALQPCPWLSISYIFMSVTLFLPWCLSIMKTPESWKPCSCRSSDSRIGIAG